MLTIPGFYLINNVKDCNSKVSFKEKISKQSFNTLTSGINIGLHLLIFGLFPGTTFLIRKGNAYLFTKYPLFDGMGDAYFKSYA